MQSGYEEDAVLVLQLVVELALVPGRKEETIRGFAPAVGTGGGGLVALGEKDKIYQKNGCPAH